MELATFCTQFITTLGRAWNIQIAKIKVSKYFLGHAEYARGNQNITEVLKTTESPELNYKYLSRNQTRQCYQFPRMFAIKPKHLLSFCHRLCEAESTASIFRLAMEISILEVIWNWSLIAIWNKKLWLWIVNSQTSFWHKLLVINFHDSCHHTPPYRKPNSLSAATDKALNPLE